MKRFKKLCCSTLLVGLMLPQVVASGGAYAATTKGTWRNSDKGYWYEYSDGTFAKNQWVEEKGKWYYFNAYGYMVTGWKEISKKWYYFNSTGAMATGWLELGKKWYYLGTNGVLRTGWQTISGKWYYFNSSGIMQTGWQKVAGKWYYFLPASGVMQTGWQMLSNEWYYFNSSGAMQTGWQKLSNKWYFFKADGAMAKEEYCQGYWLNKDGTWTSKAKASWKKSGSKWWFGDTSGWYAKNQWVKIDGKDYFFYKDGYLAKNQWIGNYFVGADGSWVGKNLPKKALKEVDPDSLPGVLGEGDYAYNHLEKLLDAYSFFMYDYDCNNLKADDWFDALFFMGEPWLDMEYGYEGADPLEKLWASGLRSYNVIKKSDLDWFFSTVLNMPSEYIKNIKISEEQESTIYLYKDNYYYQHAINVSDVPWETELIKVTTDGVYYYIDFEILDTYGAYYRPYSTKHRAIASYKYDRGKYFWSIYFCEPTANRKNVEGLENLMNQVYGCSNDEAIETFDAGLDIYLDIAGKSYYDDGFFDRSSGELFYSGDSESTDYFIYGDSTRSFQLLGTSFRKVNIARQPDYDYVYGVTFYSSIKDGDADEKEPYVISASNAKKQYDQLYKLFSEAYGSPDSEDGMDGAVWATWNDTNMGDVWLCWGKNLWGNDGYNDCMITITEDGAY